MVFIVMSFLVFGRPGWTHTETFWSGYSVVCASLTDQCGCASSLWAYVMEDQRQQPVFSSRCQPSLSLDDTDALYSTTDTMMPPLVIFLVLNIQTYSTQPEGLLSYIQYILDLNAKICRFPSNYNEKQNFSRPHLYVKVEPLLSLLSLYMKTRCWGSDINFKARHIEISD